ncbi:hypothetical protein [Kibdelosporangium aridum]|uniref:Uncharacterized protein n=1 Tax=Kibdelosporangium aridum TaxID=2030 RepID=A0A1W2DNX4_KIBAR|nr:hypothetical protein [Kibdelosporangium aridum]SMC99083.1 hypothetical protein SAMN05661093_03634 [Kibdelosporangium aridum]
MLDTPPLHDQTTTATRAVEHDLFTTPRPVVGLDTPHAASCPVWTTPNGELTDEICTCGER